MKRTFVNLVQKSLVAALLVFGALLCGTSSVEAQVGSAQDVGVNWVDQGEAMTRVKTVVESLGQDPNVHFTGSDTYIRVYYFKAVYRRLAADEPVYLAALHPLQQNPSSFIAPDAIPGVTLSDNQRQALFNEAKNLLKN
ncbi:MAG: hypothetical protein NZM43_13720 [Saprospiraceae bacterium]|nr:hypothetical protein [Saprospiraceae bacterium]MDW8230992.1 hypothetical protein [Saprospiraceae bacterium]MDW8485373.1 hypothetical protein [Saprospiraceae bacterium]